jgi:hypothetical protein
MNKKGILVKLDDCEAVFMTRDFKYYKVKSKPYMILGQEYEFKKKDIILPQKQYITKKTFVALAAASLFFILAYFTLFMKGSEYAYLDIDINPSIELIIDSKEHVVGTRAINKDAEKLLDDTDLKGKKLFDSVSLIIKNSIKEGYIEAEAVSSVLVSASLKNENGNREVLDRALKECENAIGQAAIKNIKTGFIKVDEKSRKQAVKNGMSMGRYALYLESKKKGNNITIEEAKNKPLDEMLKVGIKEVNSGRNIVPSTGPQNSKAGGSYATVSVLALPKYTPNSTTQSTWASNGLSTTSTIKSTNFNKNTPGAASYVKPETITKKKPVVISPTPIPSPALTQNFNYDLNGDGIVNKDDISYIQGAIQSNRYEQRLDLNSDKVIDKKDYYLLVDIVNYRYVTIVPTNTPKSVSMKYDMDGDGYLNARDIDLVYAAVKNGRFEMKYDLNNDKVVDYEDYNIIKQAISPGLVYTPKPEHVKYDLNGDRCLDAKDLEMVYLAIKNGRYDMICDVNSDKVVNDIDYGLVKDAMQ